MWNPSPPPAHTLKTLAVCGLGSFILTAGLAEDIKELKDCTALGGRGVALLNVFLHFSVGIILGHVSFLDGAAFVCSWLMRSCLNLIPRPLPRTTLNWINSEAFRFEKTNHTYLFVPIAFVPFISDFISTSFCHCAYCFVFLLFSQYSCQIILTLY